MRKIENVFFHFGRFVFFVFKIFAKPEKSKPYFKQIIREFDKIGIDSLPIIFIISIFMGAVITLQAAINLTNPIIPREYLSYAARDSIILEFASTMICLILAGKIGANITSELGTMRITQQIDALEMMGVNSAGYLVLPKIISTLVFFPLFNFFSIIIGIFGGWLIAYFTQLVNIQVYEDGLRLFFNPYYIFYSQVKTIIFGLTITLISSYLGYYVEGGSVEVGKAATNAIVVSSILILLFNVMITNLML